MNPTRFVCAGLFLLLVGGCASSAPGPAPARPTQMVENRDIRNESASAEWTVAAAPEDVWGALQAVYEELELEVTALDPASGVLAARDNRMRRLGGQQNSYWVDCGSDVMGPVADRSYVTFDVVSWIRQGSRDSSTLEVRVQAQGRRRDGASGELICSSEGALEAEIHERVTRRVAGD